MLLRTILEMWMGKYLNVIGGVIEEMRNTSYVSWEEGYSK